MTARPPRARRAASQRPTAALLVTVLLAVLAIAVGPAGRVDTQASTTAGQVAGTRVRVHNPAQQAVVAASGDVLAGQGRAATTPAAKEVVGSRVAPQTTGLADDWWRVSNVGGNRAGTLVPESFDLSVAGQKFTVHSNATKHMAEYATGRGSGSVPFSSFAGSVERAVQGGLQSGRNFVKIGPWELGIDTRGNVIYHAVYKP